VIQQASGSIELPVTGVTRPHFSMTEIKVTILGVYSFARLARIDASVFSFFIIALVTFSAIVFGTKEARGSSDGSEMISEIQKIDPLSFGDLRG
jgi:hypothetical protein